MQKPLAILLLPVLLAACSSAPPVTATSSGAGPAPAVASSQAPAGTKPVVSELNDPASGLARRSVYFPYDNFTVDTKYEQMLGTHAGYLTRNPTARVTLEGNADERGSSEYNLALGQKRAEAVRKSLSLRGVADKQIEPISYGKEKPEATCHDESCWQENRRTDIVYVASH